MPSEQGAIMTDIHSCSLYCDRPECIKAQRDEMRGKLAQPEQPEVRTGNCLRVGVCASEGHKIQPQRTWVGLTDEEKAQFVVAYYPSNWDRKTAVSLMSDYEKYLKEKNNV
jgi:hypothetical protein